MNTILLIHVTGRDQVNLTAFVLFHLTRHEAKNNGLQVLDIKQAVLHDTWCCGLVVMLPEKISAAGILKELFNALDKQQCYYNFRTVTDQEYQTLLNTSDESHYVVTLMAPSLKASAVDAVIRTAIQHGLEVTEIKRMSSLSEHSGQLEVGGCECCEISFKGKTPDIDALRSSYRSVSSQLKVDVVLQEESVYRCHRRLVVFDMDSTLIDAEVIDLLAEEAGRKEQVARITASAMRGELDFNKSFAQRVKMLAGLDRQALKRVASRMPVTRGAGELFTVLRKLGYRTAIISGGFTYFAEYLQQQLGVDYVFGNPLDCVDGLVSGEVSGQIIDGERKAELMQQLAKKEGITLGQVVAVGDGANDIPMLNLAGLGVAFHAKPFVRQSTQHSVTHASIDSLLYLLGHNEVVLRSASWGK